MKVRALSVLLVPAALLASLPGLSQAKEETGMEIQASPEYVKITLTMNPGKSSDFSFTHKFPGDMGLRPQTLRIKVDCQDSQAKVYVNQRKVWEGDAGRLACVSDVDGVSVIIGKKNVFYARARTDTRALEQNVFSYSAVFQTTEETIAYWREATKFFSFQIH